MCALLSLCQSLNEVTTMRTLRSCCILFLVDLVIAQIVYVTDLPAYTQLAPCAASAVSYAVNSLTYKQCAQDVTALASCVCTKDQNSSPT